MAGVHRRRARPALHLQSHVVVLVIGEGLRLREHLLGEDDLPRPGAGLRQAAGPLQVPLARPALAGDLSGQLIDLPGGLLAQGGEEPVRVAERRVLL